MQVLFGIGFIALIGIHGASAQSSLETPCEMRPEEFRSVDLRDQFGPVRDQGCKGWCYSTSAADQLTHWAYRTGIEGFEDPKNLDFRVSPLAMSAYYAHKERREQLTDYFSQRQKEAPIRAELKEVEAELESMPSLIEKREESIIENTKSPKLIKIREKINALNAKQTELTREINALGEAARKNSKLANPAQAERLTYQIYRLTQEFVPTWDNDPQLQALKKRREELYDKSWTLKKTLSKSFEEPGGGGYGSQAINQMFENGICIERDARTDHFERSWAKREAQEHLKYLSHLGASTLLNSFLYPQMIEPGGEEECQRLVAVGLAFPNLPVEKSFQFFGVPLVPSIKEILSHWEHLDPLLALVKRSCQPIPVPKGMRPKAKRIEFDFTELDKRLDNGESVGISYYSSIFSQKGKNYRDLLDQQMRQIKNNKASTGERPHASLVVGKIWSCQFAEPAYIIRNTWGREACLRKQRDFNPLTPSEASDKTSDAYKSWKDDQHQLFLRHYPCAFNCLDLYGTEKSNDQSRYPWTKERLKRAIKVVVTDAALFGHADRNACERFCAERKQRDYVDTFKPPFACTSDGYFVVPRSLMENSAAYRLTVIDNN